MLLLLIAAMTTCVASAQAAAPLRVAILQDDIPGLSAAVVERLRTELTSAGFAVLPITAEQLADGSALNRDTHDVLVLTNSPRFPGRASANVERFLQAGGHLALLGGKAYSEPLCKVGGQWRDRKGFETLLSEVPCPEPLFTFDNGDLAAWNRGTNKPELPSRAIPAAGKVGQCMRLELKGLGQWQWDVFTATLPRPSPATDDLVCFYARGGDRSPHVSIEVDEADGSRWVTTVDLATEWRRFVIEAAAFRFFKDGSPPGRGGADDHVRIGEARRISFGLATGLSNHPDGDHEIEIDEVGTARSDLGASLADFAPPNTLCFDDYEPYVLRDGVRVARCANQDLFPAADAFDGAVSGLSAVGFTLWDRSRFVPLLQVEDRHGRNRGWACSAMVHYDGKYKGGCWLLSGITDESSYLSAAFSQCLTGFLKSVATRNLPQEFAEENQRLQQVTLELTTPAPGPLTKSPAGRDLLGPDGKRFFMIGCDNIGSLDRKFFGGPWQWWLEQDFRRARDAGLNCMRIYGASALFTGPAKLAALKELARRYGIYLLVTVVDHTTLLTREELEARGRLCAEAFKDEPMLLGYDLQNEPYAYKLAEIKDGDQTLGDRYPLWKRWGEYEQWAGLQMEGNFTSFPGVTGPLPRNDEWGPILDATDGIFSDWIRWQVQAIRSVDKAHWISVGYNSVFDCLPANSQLDFVSHHGYQPPTDFDGVMKNLTTFDRLRKVWPDKPVSFGEFGYTNGMKLGGEYLDLHTSALGEFLHYLYAFANGFAGCMKWTLTDHPLELSRQQCQWIPPDDFATHIDQGRYGFLWSDGTHEARPKPLVHALRVLREYVDSGGESGDLQVVPASTRIGTGYVFRSPRALFVGNVTCDLPELQFQSEQAANVLLRWDAGRLRIMATTDVTVRLKPGAFVEGGGMDWVEVELLEGEEVEVSG